jgi:hypothetical protein
VAFDGATLWHATDGLATVFQTNLSGVPTGVSFPDPQVIGFEDLEFDPITFAPKCALWGTTAGAPTVAAYEIPCGVQALVANGDAYSTNEDTPLTVAEALGVLANDTGSGLTAAVLVAVNGPGSVTLNADGSFAYAPPTNFHEPATFTYRANNGSAESNVATVTITVTPVNDAPVAYADAYDMTTAAMPPPLVVLPPGVLGNDTDVDNDVLSAVLVSGPTNGALNRNVGDSFDGSFTYTPNTGFSGTDTFTYRADDGSESENSSSDVVTVTIKVNNPAEQTAKVTNFSDTCEVTLTVTHNATTEDSFVIRSDDFLKHWNCRLFRKSTGEEIAPQSVHGAMGTVFQISGVESEGDLVRIAAGATRTFTARGNLCQVFQNLPDGDLEARCTTENSQTDPTRDASGQCLDPEGNADPSGASCLDAPIRTYIAEAPPFDFSVAQGTPQVADQCPSLAGDTLKTGCPWAVTVEVILNNAPLNKVPVRIFNRNSPEFLALTGGTNNPPASLYPKLYEADKGRAGACVTRKLGFCVPGLGAGGQYLAIVKFTNPQTGAPDYAGRLVSRFIKNVAGVLLYIKR